MSVVTLLLSHADIVRYGQLDGWMADPSLLFGCRSDVLGQVMPLVGKDWTQSGVARLFSSIKVL